MFTLFVSLTDGIFGPWNTMFIPKSSDVKPSLDIFTGCFSRSWLQFSSWNPWAPGFFWRWEALDYTFAVENRPWPIQRTLFLLQSVFWWGRKGDVLLFYVASECVFRDVCRRIRYMFPLCLCVCVRGERQMKTVKLAEVYLQMFFFQLTMVGFRYNYCGYYRRFQSSMFRQQLTTTNHHWFWYNFSHMCKPMQNF